jgi:hypothetical protein
VGGILSELIAVTRSVVQVYVLKPLIFSIFINDIVAQIDFCQFHMYADDVQLHLSDDPCSLVECIRRMNADLDRLYILAADNGLCLNPEKSQAIVIGFSGFHTAAVQLVSMRSVTIPFCTRVKSLGLTINSRIAWDDQINIVCRRAYEM